MLAWLRLAARPDVATRALKMALVVGPVLLLINHGDVLAGGHVDVQRVSKMILTVLVPYAVSTWSSVGALRASVQR